MKSMSDNLELTILMPCLNEAKTVATCAGKARRYLESRCIRGEILVADNGSVDGSQQLACAMGARVISVALRGYGNALKAGIQAARGRFIIMGDADDSYDFTCLDDFIERLRAGDQLVMGNRFAGGIAQGAMPWHHRYVGNPALTFIGRLLFRSNIGDFHCGLRGFDRAALLQLGLESEGMEFASEMVVKASLHGLRIAEVPTTLVKDGRGREPHLRSFRDGWRHLKFLLLHCPRWLFLYPGLALLLAGMALQIGIYPGPLAVGRLNLDVHSMLYGCAATIVGTQVLVYWILSQYVAHRNGILPQIHGAVTRIALAPLEFGLTLGLLLFVSGAAWAGYETASWASAGFTALDPLHAMRRVIPSMCLMVTGCELLGAALFLSIAGLGAHADVRRDRPRSNGARTIWQEYQPLDASATR